VHPLATGVRDEIQVGDGVQVVPAGHKDSGVSSDISRASCQSDAFPPAVANQM
jgi:hypothetical protein